MASVDADSRVPDGPAPSDLHDPSRPVARIVGVGAVVLLLDQLTKWWAVDALADPPRVIDLFWTLRFNLLYNRGTAFSLTDNSGPVVSVIAVVVIVVLLRSGRRQRSPWVQLSYGLVAGGTVGNLVDRIFREGDGLLGGGVVDFVDLQWFPVFNVADAALTIGIIVLLIAGFFTDAFDEPADDGTTP
ncbi:signal peptidase II [Actinospongicola halichondriae]|uniref:signal peptidase II n=1 Tax=Actinospongicola halichondriae TaxID=3236844 RepID=UPI003D44E793